MRGTSHAFTLLPDICTAQGKAGLTASVVDARMPALSLCPLPSITHENLPTPIPSPPPSVLAGTLGALASVFGKLGFDAQALTTWLPAAVLDDPASSSSSTPALLLLLARGTCVGLMLLCNVAMTSFFVQSLHQSGSLLATVINTGISFILTGLAGRVVFQENLSLQWWGGAGLTLGGVALLAGCAPATVTGAEKKGVSEGRREQRSEGEKEEVRSPAHGYNTRRRKSPVASTVASS